MAKHIQILGALYIALGALGILVALIVLVAVTGGGALSGDREAMAVTAVVGPSVAILILVLSVPNVIGGYGLLKRKSWARILVMVLAVLNLFSFPLGTALGIYALWAMTRPETQSILTS